MLCPIRTCLLLYHLAVQAVRFYPRGPVSLASFSPFPLPPPFASNPCPLPPGTSFFRFFIDIRYFTPYNKPASRFPNLSFGSPRTRSEEKESVNATSPPDRRFFFLPAFRNHKRSFVIQRVGSCHIIHCKRAFRALRHGVPRIPAWRGSTLGAALLCSPFPSNPLRAIAHHHPQAR